MRLRRDQTRESSWSCSGTCWFRSPKRWAWCCARRPIRPISRNAATIPAPSTMRAARLSPWAITCLCIWGHAVVGTRRDGCVRSARGRRGASQRSVSRRNALAGHHGGRAGLYSRAHGRRRPAFYVANRAHHADVGGMSPGSMPLAREIFQEGIRIPPVLIRRRGKIDRELLDLLLANVRTPVEREGDLMAQLAAIHRGETRLRELVAKQGEARVVRNMREIQDYSARMMQAAIRKLPRGVYRFEDFLDNDGITAEPVRIRVAVTIANGRAVVDFTRFRAAGSGIRECELRRHAGGDHVRVPLPDSGRCPVHRGNLAADSRDRARRVPWSTRCLRPRWLRAMSRRRSASPTFCWARWRRLLRIGFRRRAAGR